jgi:hypothetical protein
LQQFRHDSFVRGVQMLDDDEGHVAPQRNMPEKLLQGFETPGGSANADYGEGTSARGVRCSLASGLGKPFRPPLRFGFHFHDPVRSAILLRGTLAPRGNGAIPGPLVARSSTQGSIEAILHPLWPRVHTIRPVSLPLLVVIDRLSLCSCSLQGALVRGIRFCHVARRIRGNSSGKFLDRAMG